MSYSVLRIRQALRTRTDLATRDERVMLDSVRTAFEHDDELVREKIFELKLASKLACAPGCSACCYLEVSATYPEIAHLAEVIERTFTPEALLALRERLAARRDVSGGMTRQARASASRACALLVDDACSAYEARPLACRGWNSADVRPCLVSLQMPEARPSVPVHQSIRNTALAIAEGIQDGVAESGLDHAVLDLSAALALTLADRANVTARWLAGAPLPDAMKGDALDPTQGPDGLWRVDEPVTR